MSDFKPKLGSFAPYLEYMQRDKTAEPPSRPASPLTLLEILARQDRPALSMPDLQTLGGMEPARYREALKSLRDAGYISIDGPPLEEVVRLTDKGGEVARLARPT
jgi:DNA-binding PadR family transcriptional regulator